MNPFANKDFLNFCRDSYDNVIDYGITKSYEGEDFPYLIKSVNNLNFFITPICFCGPKYFNSKENISFINYNFNKFSLRGGFIQTRNIINKNINVERHNGFSFLEDYRINYRLYIEKNLNLLKNKMNSTSRRYINKIIKNHDLNEFILKRVNYNDTDGIAYFLKYYNHNAKTRNYSKLYRFTFNQWRNLIKNEVFQLYTVIYKNIFISGTIIVNIDDGLGYTFVANNKTFTESSRINILKLYEYCSKFNLKYVDLGGGIKEGDSLAFFKESLGSEKNFFKRIKFVYTNDDEKELDLSFLKANWPAS